MTAPPDLPRQNLVPGIRASLNAKLERLLARPIVARIVSTSEDLPSVNGSADDLKDGSYRVRISIDYDVVWCGREKEIRETVANGVESAVSFLTDEQRTLLERSPRQFLALSPPPETTELISFETEKVDGGVRVVEVKLAAPPASPKYIRHLAIVPNLVQIQRQLQALHQIEIATNDGPLGPLRALVGAGDASCLPVEAGAAGDDAVAWEERLDEHQYECVRKAMATPHFAVIEGPPGSGKTTVISAVIGRALARGERVLVVSPTHVAVDNVVEKLAPRPERDADHLEALSLPVRYAVRQNLLSERAQDYWVGAKKERRGAAIARRVEKRLREVIPFADALFKIVDEDAAGHAPISSAVASVQSVICGTPIGILSFEQVRNAECGAFGLLVVDEVSKMTLPEFLAIAVKARRWVVVGDPAQLPPYNNSEENGTTLEEVMSPLLELACSVGAIFEGTRPAARADLKLVVASSEADRAAAVIRAHLAQVMPNGTPSVGTVDAEGDVGIVVCSGRDSDRACDVLARSSGRPAAASTQVRLLVERGVSVAATAGSGHLVELRERAHASIFERAFNVYHAQPWANRSHQRLRTLGMRTGLETCLPSAAALDALSEGQAATGNSVVDRRAMIASIATLFALNTISVYDWLTGIPASHFDTSPLRELAGLSFPALTDAVQPFVGSLKKQYRMHASLSRVPRELFYFGEALFDGRTDDDPGCWVSLRRVEPDGVEGEFNHREVEAIVGLIQQLNALAARHGRKEVMVITPYREQEARLADALAQLRARSAVAHVDIDLCTLDRCQGREADFVLLSLVRSRATRFFDMPKRWNVALTRAKQGLFVVGDINAYLREAAEARRESNWQPSPRRGRVRVGEPRPLMSLLARIIEAYERQISSSGRLRVSGSEP